MRSRGSRVDWFNLIEIDGPFLDPEVLGAAFPQGLQDWLRGDPARRRLVLDAFEEWSNQGFPRSLQRAWFDVAFMDGLRYPSDRFLQGPAVPDALRVRPTEQPGVTLAPDTVLVDRAGKPLLLVLLAKPDERPRSRRREGVGGWTGSPVEAMTELLRQAGPANDLRLGLVTNGKEWYLVHVAPGVTSSVIAWDAALWREEPLAFDAFVALLEEDRFTGVPDDETLAALFRRSQDAPKTVTEQLGTQVRQAVEILVGAIDRANRERGGALLAEVAPAQVYEAAVSVMMRLIVLFYAEERGLLPAEVDFQQNYAVGGVLDWLDGLSQRFGDDEVLARRYDAWPRLLATFRAIHGGLDHDELRLPAYGGTLFDPDRFPFLEGRAAGTSWRDTPASPIKIDNQTVRHLLSALQRLEGSGTEGARRLSYRALDVEQIGHVYERLLDHTAVVASEPALGLVGKAGEEPEVALAALEAARARGDAVLMTLLREQTGRSEAAIRRLLNGPVEPAVERRLPEACDNDPELRRRIEPFATLIRTDRASRPVVIPRGGLYVTAGIDRRASGAHYTPRALTEEIVKHALDPLVFDGPAEGKPEAEWKRKPARAMLELRVCDPAMGSGGFLVQACRYLADHLVAAWDEAEARYGKRVVTPFGELDRGDPALLPLPADPDERLARARRAVVDHCLFGVDKNPLAVEMAKLSLWLITLQKDRPFTFLDHALRHGDSLLGLSDVKQLTHWSLDPGQGKPIQAVFQQAIKRAVEEALVLRRRIEATPVERASDAEEKARLLARAEEAMAVVRLGADLLVGAALSSVQGVAQTILYGYLVALGASQERQALTATGKSPGLEAEARLRADAVRLLDGHAPLHWPLEFPEVFAEERGGFDAFVGNPPFMGGQKLTGAFGVPYRNYLVEQIADGTRGSADLVAYFFLRVLNLLRPGGMMGLIATNTIAQGDTREVGLDRLTANGATIIRAIPSRPWPGEAALEVAWLWLRRGDWRGEADLGGQRVRAITPYLTVPGRANGTPYRLSANAGKSFQGSIVLGLGFVLTPEEAQSLIAKEPHNKDVLFPYLNGEDLNSRPDQSPSRWVINFHDWPEERARTYPECYAIVRERVKPERDRLASGDATARDRARRWWQFGRPTIALYEAVAGMERVLVLPRVSKYLVTVFQPTGLVTSEATVVIADSSYRAMAVIQSSIHDAWARAQGSTLETRMRYTPSDSFETFAMPSVSAQLEEVGGHFDEIRSAETASSRRGITELYNLVHDERHFESDVEQLRSRWVEMDEAVAAAYGWSDLDLEHGFHETKQEVRFTISEAARREVLDRLLELNHQRYAEEVAKGLHPEAGKKGGRGRRGQAALTGLGE